MRLFRVSVYDRTGSEREAAVVASTAEEAFAAEVTVEKEAEDMTEAVPGPRSREIVVTRGGLVGVDDEDVSVTRSGMLTDSTVRGREGC